MEQDKKRELQEKITKFQPIARNGGKKTNLPRTLSKKKKIAWIIDC